MYWWMEQMNAYVPGLIGAVNVLDWPVAMSPVLNPPVLLVMVCATWSSLVTVTVAPGATVTVWGAKAKFLMVMACELLGFPPEGPEPPEGALVPDEHAAKQMALPNTATIAPRRVPRSACRHVERVVLFCGWVSIIAVYSEDPASRMSPQWFEASD
jgi:hypothetical protein